MTALVPVDTTSLTQPADDRYWLQQIAEAHAVRWLHGYTSPATRNAYSVDIGLSPAVRAALPGAPTLPEPPSWWSWIPWALDHHIDPAGPLTKQDAEAYAHTLHAQAKNVRRRRWAALCAFYRSLRVEGVVFCDPGELVNRRVMGLAGADPSPTLPLHPGQVRALYLAAELTGKHRARHRAMLAVLATTGCRAAELVGINLDDYRVQPEGHVLIQLHGKGDHRRWVQLPAADAALVDDYLKVRTPMSASTAVALPDQPGTLTLSVPLFTTSTGARVHVSAVTQMLRTIAKQPRPTHPRPEVQEAARVLALIDRIHPHQLRHTYAVTAEEAGVPVSQIQADLGHASLATTQTYLHARDRARNSAASVVSGIYRSGS